MHDHWSEFGPPVYMMVAAYLGVAGQSKEKPKEGNLADLAKQFGNGKPF